MTTPPNSPFRREAVEHHATARSAGGGLLELSPFWIRWAYPLLVVSVGLAALALGGLRVSEYVGGPALVRSTARVHVRMRDAGLVEKLSVRPGETVRRGQALVTLESTRAREELERTRQAYERALAARWRDRSNSGLRQAVSAAEAAMERARESLSARTLTAPCDGLVQELRTEVGRFVAAGETTVVLEDAAGARTIVAALPGHAGPRIRPGERARFEVHGFEHVYIDATVAPISHEIVGPGEARRLLGPELGDIVAMDGPVLLVEAHLDGLEFTALGSRYALHSGMSGRLEVELARRPLYAALLPSIDGPWRR